MKKPIIKLLFWVLILILPGGISNCKKDFIENRKTVQELFKMYANGEINECKLNGETVFSAGYNAYDAGGGIYDKDGKPIGNCNYAWGLVDPICSQLTDCETIYRVKNNIWGRPPVNKYRLKK